MFTYKSTQFNMEGFALVLGASFIGGIRWTLTQILLQKAELGEGGPGPQARGRRAGPGLTAPCVSLLQGSRTPSTPCSTCSPLCSSGSSLSLPYLKVGCVARSGAPQDSRPSCYSEPSAVVAAEGAGIREAALPWRCLAWGWTDTETKWLESRVTKATADGDDSECAQP